MSEYKEPLTELIEKLSAEVHGIYCRQYKKDNGKPYRTGGDYSKLDERTKQYDRNIVLWHLRAMRDQSADDSKLNSALAEQIASLREKLSASEAERGRIHGECVHLLHDRNAQEGLRITAESQKMGQENIAKAEKALRLAAESRAKASEEKLAMLVDAAHNVCIDRGNDGTVVRVPIIDVERLRAALTSIGSDILKSVEAREKNAAIALHNFECAAHGEGHCCVNGPSELFIQKVRVVAAALRENLDTKGRP